MRFCDTFTRSEYLIPPGWGLILEQPWTETSRRPSCPGKRVFLGPRDKAGKEDAMNRKRTMCQYRISRLIIVLFLFRVLSVQAATPDEIRNWLQAHNAYRSLHGVGPVGWSEKIAAGAQAYAGTCPTGHGDSGYGENLAWASYSMSEGDVVKMWYDEKPRYDEEHPGFSPETGHFTQVVWKGTAEIGCGHAADCPGLKNVWVCRYNPPGNYLGLFSKNVFPLREILPEQEQTNLSAIPVETLRFRRKHGNAGGK